MWADNETSEDLLGFKVHADLLIDVIRDDKILPITIGVFGDWGSGKSSILKIINENLIGKDDDLKDDTLVIYLNGWVFEGYDDAKAALLETIIDKFKKHKTLGNKIKDKATKLLKSVKWMRAMGFGFKKIVVPAAAAYFTGGLSLVPFLVKEFNDIDPDVLKEKLTGQKSDEFLKGILNKQEDNETSLVREFRDDFEEMIRTSEIKKLVVIIDDLDRCTPERIIENLEAIKLFLNVPKTAFIIGADPRIVRHAIEFKYKTDSIENSDDANSRNKRIVSDYLEKLIQVPYNLPKLSDSEVETYLTLLFCKDALADDFKNVHEAFSLHKENDRYSVFGMGNIQGVLTPDQKNKLGNSVTLIASLSPVITDGLNGNPRQIKRFLNTFTLRKRLVEIAKFSNFKVDILAKLMVLEYANPDLFRKLYEWQAQQHGIAKEIVEMEALSLLINCKEEIKNTHGIDWTTDKMIKWLKVEPKLNGVDLRNYYWISRDQLTSSISGASLIPEYIRNLFSKLVGFGSAKILASIVTNDILPLNENEIDLNKLFILLESEITKSPQNDELHKIFIELMQNNIVHSLSTYERIVNNIDNKLIPFSLANNFKTAATKNGEIEKIFNLFESNSKISKALKIEK